MAITPDEISRIQRYEGSVSYLYLDIKGNPTIGYGHLVASAVIAATLPFIHKSDGQPATTAERQTEWTTIKSKPFGQAYAATYYNQFCTLTLQAADINNLLSSDLTSAEQQLINYFPGYAGFPQPAQAGLIDMVFNLGLNGLITKFPNFVTAVKNQDWTTAANECNRPQLNPNRNAEVKALFLQAAAAVKPKGTGTTGTHPPILGMSALEQPAEVNTSRSRNVVMMLRYSTNVAESAIAAIKEISLDNE